MTDHGRRPPPCGTARAPYRPLGGWLTLIVALAFMIWLPAACTRPRGDQVAADAAPKVGRPADLDSDGIPDDRDDDIDGDGLDNASEGSGDTDGDGVPDQRDWDSDNDGRPDIDEARSDADRDGLEDRLDRDSDGDGVADGIDPSDSEDNSDNSEQVLTDTEDNSDEAITDTDGDEVADEEDNCPNVPNKDQTNRYGDEPGGGGTDAAGDVCDDTDLDDVVDAADKCPLDPSRTLEPCHDRNREDDSDTCLGIMGSIDPDIHPTEVTSSRAGGAQSSMGDAYFSPLSDLPGLFSGCVPVTFGDGGPVFNCQDVLIGALPGAEIVGQYSDAVYLVTPLPGGPPDHISLDSADCRDGSSDIPTLPRAPELADFARLATSGLPHVDRPPIDHASTRFDPAELRPADVGDLTTVQQERLVDESLDELSASQVAEIDEKVLAEVPADKVTSLAAAVVVQFPADTLYSIDRSRMEAIMSNDFSGMPDAFIRRLTGADLWNLNLATLASFDEHQIGLLDREEQAIRAERVGEGPTP